jgi:hypothetical protein
MLAAADFLSAFPEGRSLGGATRPHLFLLGSRDTTEAALQTLLCRLRPPVVHWEPGTVLPLTGTPTIVIRQVATISIEQQHEWVSWLDQRGLGRPQFVTTSDTPIFPLVEQGRFLDVLYYRLNTLMFELTDAPR